MIDTDECRALARVFAVTFAVEALLACAAIAIAWAVTR